MSADDPFLLYRGAHTAANVREQIKRAEDNAHTLRVRSNPGHGINVK